MNNPEWLMIDGVAPFFRNCPGKRINWSKIPFSHVEASGMLDGAGADMLRLDFRAFALAAAADGYNAITLDDLAHLIAWDGHPAPLEERLARYRAMYRDLFEIAAECRLRVLVTSDVFSMTPGLESHLGRNGKFACWLAERLESLFTAFPDLAGVIFRIGESDSIGTTGDFQSRLLIRTPRQANRFLRTLLPVFERHGRTLFFRTWTVGAHSIGDLIWHRRTFERVFRGIRSDAMVVSMKYGESDFFRYLPVNAHFFRTSLKTVVELQSRREYEGFGEYPSFTGWEVERILRQLEHAPNRIGASVWCQTGGWGKFRRLTYLDDSSIWVELNNSVTAALCRGLTCEDAVRRFCAQRLPGVDPVRFLAFLALTDDVIRELLYIREFAARKLFFRRLRVPPLVFPYWDRIVMTPAIRNVFRNMVENHVLCVNEGYAALRKLDILRDLAAGAGIPQQGLDFQRDTFEILAILREYIFADAEDDAALTGRLEERRAAYRDKWKPRYAVKIEFAPPRLRRFFFRLLRRLLLREQRGYRLLDTIFTLRLLTLVYPLLGRWRRRLVPKFARKQAMGIDSLFK
jgi:hypothetical protein